MGKKLNPKRALLFFLSVVVSLSAMIVLLFNAVQQVAFDEKRYAAAYEKYDRPEYIGISMDDLKSVTHEMLLYLQGKRPALDMQAEINGSMRQVFDQREVLHMIDVQRLFLQGFALRRYAYGALAVGFFLLILLGRKEGFAEILAKGWLRTLMVAGTLFALLCVWCVIDFDSAFIAFHHAFFTNDFWLLDPTYEVLIQMFPEEFFFSVALAIVWRAVLYIGLMTAVAIMFKRMGKEAQKRIQNDPAQQ